MDNRIIIIGVLVLVILLLIWFLKSNNIVSNLLGYIGRLIIFLIVVILIVFIITILTKEDSVEAPGRGTNTPSQNSEIVPESIELNSSESNSNQSDSSELYSSEIEYTITIRQKDVEVTSNIFGNVTYSEKFCTQEEISNEIKKIALKDPLINIIDDYADYVIYKFVIDELLSSGITSDRIFESIHETK